MDYQKKINATLLTSAMGYAVMVMDKGDYQDSLDILLQIEALVLIQDQIGIHSKVDLLLGKITLQLILGQSSHSSIKQAQEMIAEMQQQNIAF